LAAAGATIVPELGPVTRADLEAWLRRLDVPEPAERARHLFWASANGRFDLVLQRLAHYAAPALRGRSGFADQGPGIRTLLGTTPPVLTREGAA
jgi:hypothetical protein